MFLLGSVQLSQAAPMYPLRNYRGHSIAIYCPKCGRAGPFLAVVDLIERYGPETEVDDVLARCRCTGCGRVGKPDIRFSWTETAPTPGQGTGWPRQ